MRLSSEGFALQKHLLAGLIQLHTLAEHGKLLNCVAHLTVTIVWSLASPAPDAGEQEEGAGGHHEVQDRQDQAHLRAKKGLAPGSSAWAADEEI